MTVNLVFASQQNPENVDNVTVTDVKKIDFSKNIAYLYFAGGEFKTVRIENIEEILEG